MSAPFKVGDICILQYARHPENNGLEVTITDIGLLLDDGSGVVRFGYQLDFLLPNGRIAVAAPHQLRRPPSDSHERTYMQKWRDMAGKAPQRVGETV